MKKTHIIFGMLLALGVACAPEEEAQGGNNFGQMASFVEKKDNKAVSFYTPISLNLSTDDIGQEKEIGYQIQLLKENDQNVKISLALDNSLVEKYNSTYGKSYQVLPEEYISYTNSLEITPGNIYSNVAKAKIQVSSNLKENTSYMFALNITSISNNVSISQDNKTLLVEVKLEKESIKKTFAITRDQYFEIDKNNSNASDIGTTFTLEGLINVQKFRSDEDSGDAKISTFMGTEGATLLRFGDHGNLPDRIQPNGQGTELPVSLKTDKWYHVAFVVEGNKCYGYINGEKVGEFNKGGRLGEFFIGRSYNENRGIVARFSEIRLWSVARSGAQIKENMYKVSGSTTGLYAYWKMNEVKNNQIPDASNNDRPLILKKQKDKSRLEISIYDEKNEVNIEN